MPFSKQHQRFFSLVAPCHKTVSSSRPERGGIVIVAKSLSLANTLIKKAWERAEGSDRIKSSDPFLQAAASAEETLEDRDAEIWAHGSGMEDVWRCSQHSLLPASSPPTHSPALIELFALPPVIVAGAPNSLLLTASLAYSLLSFPRNSNSVHMYSNTAWELQKACEKEEEAAYTAMII